MAIYQADQYMIPFSIRHKKEIVAPESVDNVKIVLGKLVKSYEENTLSFLDGKWLFPLTSAETIAMEESVECQIEIVYGNNVIHSKPFNIKVKSSLEPFIKR